MRDLLAAILVVGLMLALGGTAEAVVFSDNFDTAHDYLADGVVGTGWDGTLGLGLTRAEGVPEDVMDANTSRAGSLYIQSGKQSFLSDPWDPYCPILYKEITGEFIATVQVTDFAGTYENRVFHNDCGLIARAPGDPGVNEDWASVNYFPTWVANVGRDTDNNARYEWGGTAYAWVEDTFAAAKPWLQIERSGDLFYFRISDDGVNWENLDTAGSPFGVGTGIQRTDLPDTLQVGLFQAVYDPAELIPGYAAFDNLEILQPEVLTWDETIGNPWDSGHWGAGPSYPTITEHAVVPSGVVNVSGEQAARSLDVGAGGAVEFVGTDAKLTVLKQLTMAGSRESAESEVALAAGSQLSLGEGGHANLLWTAGNSTIAVDSAGLRVDILLDQDITGTLSKQGGGTLFLDNTVPGGVNAAATTFRIEEGTVHSRGGDPLGGSTAPVELAGGKFAIARGYTPGPVPAGAVANWKFDEATGATAFDSADSYDGALLGLDPATDWVAGQIGNALDFDGTNDKVSVDGLASDLSEVSVAVWVNRRSSGWQSIFHTKNWDTGDLHYILTDRILFACNGLGEQQSGSNDFWSTSTIPENQWTHVVSTYSVASQELKIYINGVLDAQTTFTGTNPIKFTNGFFIGSDNNGAGRWLNGQMDDLLIYDRALTEGEVSAMYGGLTTPPNMSGTDVIVSAPSAIDVYSPGTTVAFDTLTMQNGTSLSTTGTAKKITFNGTSIDAAEVGFDPRVDTDFGVMDANGADVTIRKLGPGTWKVKTAPVNLGSGSSWKVEQGTLELVGDAATVTNKITLTGGMLSVTGQLERDPSAATLVTAGDLLVNLEAWDLPAGAIASWANTGSLSGDFAASGDPTAERVEGIPTVTFDGSGDWFTGPTSVPGIEGADGRSIEVWTYNPSIADEETLVAWAHRGGPDGTNMSFNYGTNGLYGAVGHWGAPDLGWNGAPAAGEWHHLVYTYDGVTARVYADGVEKNSEDSALDTYSGDPIRVATQTNADGTPNTALEGSLSITVVRIHDGVLLPADVLNNYNELAPSFRLLPVDMPGVHLTVAGDSGFAVANSAPVNVGSLTLEEGILTTTGANPGILFGGTTIDAAPDAVVGVDLEVPTELRQIDVLNATPVTFVKRGPVDLVLTEDSVGSGFGNVTFEAQEGRLVGLHASNPFGSGPDAAALRVDGGEIVLANGGSDDPAHFDNALTVAGDGGTLTAGTGGLAGATGPPNVKLGSPGNAVALTDGILTLRSTDGYSLDVAGPLSGPGSVAVTEGTVTLSGGGTAGTATVSGGTVHLGADLNLQSMDLPSGTVNTGANRVIVSGALRVGTLTYSTSAGTLAASGPDLVADMNLSVTEQDSTLTIGAPPVPSEGLVAYWAFEDDPASTTAADTSGSPTVCDGALMNDAAFITEGKIGSAIQFGADNGYVDLPDGFEDFTGGFAVSAWVKPEVLNNWGRVIDFGNGAEAECIVLANMGTSSDLRFELWDTPGGTETLDISGVYTVGEWQHLVATVDAGPANQATATVYLDGVPIGTHTAFSVPAKMLRTNNFIGESNWGADAFFQGVMDEIFIYARELSPEEVDFLYQAGVSGAYPVAPVHADNAHLEVTVDAILNLDTTGDASVGGVTVADGKTLTLAPGPAKISIGNVGGPGTIEGDFSVTGTLSPGDSIGTLTVEGSLTMEEGSVYLWELGPSAADLVAVTPALGVLTLDPTQWTLRPSDAGLPMGDFTGSDPVVFTYETLAGNSLGGWNLDLSDVGHWEFDPGVDPSERLFNDELNKRVLLKGLSYIGEAIVSQWAPPGGGSGMYFASENWMDGTPPNGVGAEANFLEKITSPSVVTVDSPVTLGTIKFKEELPNSYTIEAIGSGEITLASAGDAQIIVELGQHTITAPLSFAGGLTVDAAEGTELRIEPAAGFSTLEGAMTKNGAGSLILGPWLLVAGPLNVNEGVLEAGEDVLARATPGGPPRVITLGAMTTLKASGLVNGLVVDTGGMTSPSTLQAVGPMTVGVLGSTDGYNYAGILNAGANSVVLLDDDKAEVGLALIGGGSLTGAKGIQLNPATVGFGGFITGDGEIHGVVTAGTPGNPAMGFGGMPPGITVYGDVAGLWNQFDNTTVTGKLQAGFSPAHNPLGPGSNAGTAQFLIGGPLDGEVTFNSEKGEYEKTTGDHTQFLVYGVAEGVGAPTVFESLELKLDEDYPDFNWGSLAAGDDIVLIQTAPWQTVQFITLPFPHYETTLVEPGLVDYGTSFEGDLQSALDLIRPKLATGLDVTYTMNPDGLALHIVPEPGTLALLLSGGLALLLLVWRRRRRS